MCFGYSGADSSIGDIYIYISVSTVFVEKCSFQCVKWNILDLNSHVYLNWNISVLQQFKERNYHEAFVNLKFL